MRYFLLKEDILIKDIKYIFLALKYVVSLYNKATFPLVANVS